MKSKKRRKKPYDKIPKYRWEFMRADLEYQEDYKRLSLLRKQARDRFESTGKPEISRSKDTVTNNWKVYYWDTPEYEEECRFKEKWDIHPARPFSFLDPEKSWEEIIEEAPKNHPFIPMLIKMPPKGGVSFSRPISDRNKKVTIRIDFSKINSVGALKDVIGEYIDEHLKRKLKRSPLKNKRRHKNYGRILELGRKADAMRKDGHTFESIAAELLKEQYNKKASSAVKTIETIYREYRRLVEGGYKDLIYP